MATGKVNTTQTGRQDAVTRPASRSHRWQHRRRRLAGAEHRSDRNLYRGSVSTVWSTVMVWCGVPGRVSGGVDGFKLDWGELAESRDAFQHFSQVIDLV